MVTKPCTHLSKSYELGSWKKYGLFPGWLSLRTFCLVIPSACLDQRGGQDVYRVLGLGLKYGLIPRPRLDVGMRLEIHRQYCLTDAGVNLTGSGTDR